MSCENCQDELKHIVNDIPLESRKVGNNYGIFMMNRAEVATEARCSHSYVRRIPTGKLMNFPEEKISGESQISRDKSIVPSTWQISQEERANLRGERGRKRRILGSYTLAINPSRCWLCGLNPPVLYSTWSYLTSPSPHTPLPSASLASHPRLSTPVFHRFSVVRRGRLLALSSSVCVYRVYLAGSRR